ncbi:MAG: epoxyqueuosine reductase QueH [Chloroflexi bacterium]|nr:epoxyqueuosine reductase QueH [Chloroflexota bacterium]
MKVVLHICCGVCAAGAAEKLAAEGHQVYGFFYNPNIHPREEYERRLEAAIQVAKELNFPVEAGRYEPQDWFAEVKGLESEPEGGRRCDVCFRHRLKQTYLYMQAAGLDAFTSTLTIGPQKSAAVINRVGQEIGGDKFLVRDFKKKAGFQRASELAKKWAIHRQHYCGCVYSSGER